MTPIPLYAFEEPNDCDHEHTELLYAYARVDDPRPGDEFVYINDGQPVAERCTDCGQLLPLK